MNKLRRKELNRIASLIDENMSKDEIQRCIADLEIVMDEENDYYYNIPENLQSSERAMQAEEAIDNISTAIDDLNEALEMENGDERNDLLEDAEICIENATY